MKKLVIAGFIFLATGVFAQKNKDIEPVLYCVKDLSNGLYQATFSYNNPTNKEVVIDESGSIIKSNNGKKLSKGLKGSMKAHGKQKKELDKLIQDESYDPVLEAMKKDGTPLNAGKIVELTGLDRKVVDKAMAELKKEEAIVVREVEELHLVVVT
mgnify:CR=1 FL=1